MAGRPGDVFLVAASRLSILAALLLLGCPIFANQYFFLGLAAFIVMMWFLATVHHLVSGVRGTKPQAGVG